MFVCTWAGDEYRRCAYGSKRLISSVPHLLFPWFFEMWPLTEPETPWLADWSAGGRDSSSSAFTLLIYKLLPLSMGSSDQIQVFMLAWKALCWLSCVPTVLVILNTDLIRHIILLNVYILEIGVVRRYGMWSRHRADQEGDKKKLNKKKLLRNFKDEMILEKSDEVMLEKGSW